MIYLNENGEFGLKHSKSVGPTVEDTNMAESNKSCGLDLDETINNMSEYGRCPRLPLFWQITEIDDEEDCSHICFEHKRLPIIFYIDAKGYVSDTNDFITKFEIHYDLVIDDVYFVGEPVKLNSSDIEDCVKRIFNIVSAFDSTFQKSDASSLKANLRKLGYRKESVDVYLKHSKSVKLNENSKFKVYDQIIMSIAGDFAENSINQDFGSGHRVLNITPSDDVINQVFSNAESEGFKEVDAHIDEDNTGSDSYVVFTKETGDKRIVFAVVFNAAENFAYVTCGYNEEEDSEYFDESKKTNTNSTKLTEAVNSVVISSELFDLVEESGTGIHNTPWTGLRVVSKGLADDLVVEIRLDSRGGKFDGNPVTYTYSGAYIAYGYRPMRYSDEDIRNFIHVLEEALKFKDSILDYITSYNK